ncbi:MAG: hypothetical protein V2J62_08520 [candidate division KSB1 bacterium]|jgi:integral membrane sensor domain MASE1|nr:hypothetical protein [candidate division KSB1 bacterium]
MESKPDKLVPAVIGGAIMGVISAVPGLNMINCLCCAGVILGGFFAVYFYKKNLGDTELNYSDGALLGALAGVFGALIGALLSAIIGVNFDQMFQQMMQYSDEIPQEAIEMIENLQNNKGALFIMSAAMGLVIDVIFGLLGGILGVAILGKKK